MRYKYALLVGDGMADRPMAELGGRTVLEAADTPNMDEVARTGRLGMVATIPEGLPPGSDVGNLSLFGYDPAKYYGGRAPIEAVSMGVGLRPGEAAFRCNTVTLADGRMEDYSAGHLDDAEAHDLIEELKPAVESASCRLYKGVDYRHLLVTSGIDITGLKTTPPHDITGRPFAPHLPQGPAAAQIRAIMDRAAPALARSRVNARRRAAGRPPVTAIWLWGQGFAMTLPTLAERYGIGGTVISAVNLVKGLGALAGLSVAEVPGATGYLGTNYAGKVAAAGAALEQAGFVFVHVEAPDETGHEGSTAKKIQAVEEFDRHVVGEMLALRRRMPDLRILVTPDHATPLSLRTHSAEPVPFAVCGPGIAAGKASGYSEKAAAGALAVDGEKLMDEFILGTFGDFV